MPLRSRAAIVQAEVRSGGCTGTPVYTAVMTPDGTLISGASAGVDVSAGSYGFAAKALDLGCTVYATTCVEATLPQEASPVQVVLAASTETAACDATSCNSGVCNGGTGACTPSCGVGDVCCGTMCCPGTCIACGTGP
jgi:hypothetical protein